MTEPTTTRICRKCHTSMRLAGYLQDKQRRDIGEIYRCQNKECKECVAIPIKLRKEEEEDGEPS